ncbi:hypothetical protein Hanom_Chr04g00361051 [Helianthus anomalus]
MPPELASYFRFVRLSHPWSCQHRQYFCGMIIFIYSKFQRKRRKSTVSMEANL